MPAVRTTGLADSTRPRAGARSLHALNSASGHQAGEPDHARREFKRKGFTLLELIVVIGIIALLAGILLPMLSKVRGAARGAICMNNLRQIAMAVAMYSQQSDGRLPCTRGVSRNPNLQLIGLPVPWAPGKVFVVPGDPNPNGYPWPRRELPEVLSPFLNESSMWFCPMVPTTVRAHNAPEADAQGEWTYERIGTTYAYNLFTRQFGSIASRPGIVIPRQCHLMSAMADRAVLLWDDPSASHGPMLDPPDPQALEPWLELPHTGGIHVAYADGHVKWHGLEDVVDANDNVVAPAVFNAPANLEAGWLR